ncbi:MAG: DUF3990 domain-containing protein [Treponema sp.]|jgi:hypothetical protein|nr:DUF3990 domain-containing protein [Treponema sp.]
MHIFHGSDVPVACPQILSSNRLLDFGPGFYTTSSRDQAWRWAQRVGERNKTRKKVVSSYEFDFEQAKENLALIEFPVTDIRWLDFVTSCRSGVNPAVYYDIATGPIANDTVYTTIQLYETGVLSAEETIRRLKVVETGNQILFHTEKALTYCTFVDYLEKDITNGKETI